MEPGRVCRPVVAGTGSRVRISIKVTGFRNPGTVTVPYIVHANIWYTCKLYDYIRLHTSSVVPYHTEVVIN
jgi:hypothetical protein